MTDNLYKTKDGAALRFFEDAAQNNAASEKHGRPIFDTVLYVEVITPGSRESAPTFELERVFAPEVGIDRPRRSVKYAEYAEQIMAFRNGSVSTDLSGTPLKAWPRMTTALIAQLEHVGIFTVDALAALPDSNLSKIGPGALGLRGQAQAFIEAAAGNAPAEALAAENIALKAEVERLQHDTEDLNRRLTELQNAQAGAVQSAPPPPPPAPLPDLGTPTPPPPATEQPAAAPRSGGRTKPQGGNAAPII